MTCQQLQQDIHPNQQDLARILKYISTYANMIPYHIVVKPQRCELRTKAFENVLENVHILHMPS